MKKYEAPNLFSEKVEAQPIMELTLIGSDVDIPMDEE